VGRWDVQAARARFLRDLFHFFVHFVCS
jgi:hypothetical protein